MNKLTAFCLILSTGLSACGMDSSDEQIIRKLTEDIKKEYQAEEPWEQINAIAQKAIKDCDISKPIIFLQTNATDNAFAASKPYRHSQEFVIIGTLFQLEDEIRYNIYHELGHVLHNDVTLKKQLFRRNFIWGINYSSLFAALVSHLMIASRTSNLLAQFSMGSLAYISVQLTGITSLFARSRKQEQKADKFAYEKLIKHGYLNSVITKISNFIYKHEFISPSRPKLLCSHPQDIERAKMGLEILQKNGINISHLIKNLPHDLDREIKANFPYQIQRFFPKFCV